MSAVRPHPLQWPMGQKRTRSRKNSAFQALALGRTRDDLIEELRRFGATGIVITTDMPTRRDGVTFYASARPPKDPGVAAYFSHAWLRQGCLACDHYNTLAENLRALVHTVSAMRKIHRHGGSRLLETVLSGFEALPAASIPGWRDVLGDLTTVTAARRVYQKLLLTRHPDHGGSQESFMELREALKAAEEELDPDGWRFGAVPGRGGGESDG